MACGASCQLRFSIRQLCIISHPQSFVVRHRLGPEIRWRTSWPRAFRSFHHHRRDAEKNTAGGGNQASFASLISILPTQCPGCGAFTKTVNPGAAGFYSATRHSVRAFANRHRHEVTEQSHKELNHLKEHFLTADHELLNSFASDTGQESYHHLTDDALKTAQENSRAAAAPVCNRCHDLLHHNRGVSIAHPTLEAVQDTIAETPHRYNHIYHILDAADFPLSLIPALQRRLSLAPQRTINRRSQKVRYIQGRKADMSFIVTRSDLLAPKKEQVDQLMPYLVQVLRDALGQMHQEMRLGNVRCVSAKRGWWTKTLKEEVWDRGGGGWMVGKVNVGKSNLLESILPKGRGLQENTGRETVSGMTSTRFDEVLPSRFGRPSSTDVSIEDGSDHFDDEGSLLPPAPLEVPFPVLPIVSDLPGTTASPIRLPFGNGKGEMVDLPGLARSDLADYVPDKHRHQLLMRERVKPKQYVVKPGQSLLAGGIVRITAEDPDVTLLAYPFLPFDSHVTSTEKATAIHTQTQDSGVESLLIPGAGNRITSAGHYELKWDVTQHRAGPLTAKAAVGLKPADLPFSIYSTDILVEGCGWIELVAQVRKYRPSVTNLSDEGDELHAQFPKVDVHSPEGRFIGCRRPMEAWLRVGTKPTSVSKPGARPRPSMKGAKKTAKKLLRKGQSNV